MLTCPCQSGNLYQDCCQPLHEWHTLAETAEQLMRSRYSAFVLQDIEYIVKTTVPMQQVLLDKNAISDWAKNTSWVGLTVLQHQTIGKRHAQVEFKAFFQSEQGEDCHHELSTFVKIQPNLQTPAKWFFLDPTLNLKLSQKQPCLCGSGEKFKRCCGQFLP